MNFKELFCGHCYKGGIRVDKNYGRSGNKKRYYYECKKCGKRKYV